MGCPLDKLHKGIVYDARLVSPTARQPKFNEYGVLSYTFDFISKDVNNVICYLVSGLRSSSKARYLFIAYYQQEWSFVSV